MYVLSLGCLFFVQFSRCVPLNFVKFRFQYLISQILKSTFNLIPRLRSLGFSSLNRDLFVAFQSDGGPKWTRTTDLTIISRVL